MSNSNVILTPTIELNNALVDIRKLSATYINESEIDINKELIDVLSEEIKKEIDQDILNTIGKMIDNRKIIINDNCLSCIKRPRLNLDDKIMQNLFNSDNICLQQMLVKIDCDLCILKDGNTVIKVCAYGNYCEKGIIKLNAIHAIMEKLK